jgi:hypothetical protein
VKDVEDLKAMKKGDLEAEANRIKGPSSFQKANSGK